MLTSRAPQMGQHFVAERKLQPLAAMLDQARRPHCAQSVIQLRCAERRLGAGRAQVKACVGEFNKVERTQKLRRVLRASEFKAKFDGFNATLTCGSIPAV